MRSVGVVASGMLALLLLAPPVAADGPEPQITDLAGDANGLEAGMDTRPASYGPADLLEVSLQTSYVAVPVNGGVRNEPTGLVIRFKTLAVPRWDGTTLEFNLQAEVDGCPSVFDGFLAGALSHPADTRPGSVEWRWHPGCPGTGPVFEPLVFQGRTFTHDGWTAEVEPDTSEFVIRIPFDSLEEDAAEVLRVGAVIREPRAMVRPTQGVVLVSTFDVSVHNAPLDRAGPGASFTVGEDVPPDGS